MNYKKIITFFAFLTMLTIFYVNYVYSESCKYAAQIQQCIEANKSWTTRSIDNFVCIVSADRDRVAYQVVLDEEFKKVDEKVDKYIYDLEEYKNLYFWINKSKTYIDWVNDIYLAKKYFHKEYNDICREKIVSQVVACNKDWRTSITNAKTMFSDWEECIKLVDKKLEIFEDVAFNVIMMNKAWVRADEKRLYDQVQRSNYDQLLNIMNVNLWYLERIWQKTPAFIGNPH